MDSTNNIVPDKTSSADGMERLVKEKKYYQFAIDEDKASTVVGSTIILPADYEDETEWSCSQNSQGTRIQQRSISTEAKPQPQVTQEDSQEDSENRKQSEPETVDGILSTSDHAKNHFDEPNEFDAFFPNQNTAVDDEENKFDDFHPPNATSTDGMLPGMGASQNPTKLSTESDVSSAFGDAYFERSYNGRTQDHQFYEASNKHVSYSPSPIHKKTPLPAFSQNGRQPLSLKDVPSSASRVKMLATNFGTESKPRKDAVFEFDGFATRPLSQKRNESNGASNFKHPQSSPFTFRPDEATRKENIEMKSNRGDWVRNQNKQYQLPRNDDDEDDDDSFDDIAQWEKKLSSLGRGMREYPERISSVSRPALTNNAIMASMLFRTYHDIDQNDVQRKINQFEADNSKQKEIRHRHGDVPDAVDADLDHMTTVSSFSECTSAYMQESWRKPSRDLIHHFTSARALDLDYSSHRRLPIRQRVEEQQGLYEA